MNHVVDLRELKTKAVSFPEPTRTLILSSPEQMPAAEFLELINTCEKLLKIQRGTDNE